MVSTPNKHKNQHLLPKIQEKYKLSSTFFPVRLMTDNQMHNICALHKGTVAHRGSKPTQQNFILMYYYLIFIKSGERQILYT